VSYNNPIIPVLTLKGIDKKIQDIQIQMNAGIEWLDKSFGLSDKITEMRDDKPFTHPVAFESNMIDPVSLMPSDIFDAFSFWTRGDGEFEDADSFPPKNPLIKFPVSCIFYVNIKKISSGSYKEVKSQCIDDIFHFFNTVRFSGKLMAKKFVDSDLSEVYKGYTIDKPLEIYMMYPKWGCRIDFELLYRADNRDDCKVPDRSVFFLDDIYPAVLVDEDGSIFTDEDGSVFGE
jgi:hypothetical protein